MGEKYFILSRSTGILWTGDLVLPGAGKPGLPKVRATGGGQQRREAAYDTGKI
jgi:hypothetical protein